MLDLWAIDALRGIALDGGALSLGALTTYTEIRRSALCREHVPALVEAAATIGAAQIQNRGTLGGNIANASPAGDTLPVLLAADAVFVLGSERGEREVAAADFWTGYRQTALAHDELVVRIRIPLVADREMRFRKVGTRRAQAISKVVMAVAGRAGDGARRRRAARCPRGARARSPPRPIRAPATEAVLEGARRPRRPPTAPRRRWPASWQPIDDVRSTADYRRVVAARDPPPHRARRRRLVNRRALVGAARRRHRVGLRRARGEPVGDDRPRRVPWSRRPTPPDGRIAFARTVFDPATNTPTGGDLWSVATDGSDLLQPDRHCPRSSCSRPGRRTARDSRSCASRTRRAATSGSSTPTRPPPTDI